MQDVGFDAIACRTMSRLRYWEDIQTYLSTDPDMHQYLSCVTSITTSRLEEITPKDLLYFAQLQSCWPLIIRVTDELDFVRLLSLSSLREAIVYFDNRFSEFVQRYTDTIQDFNKVFFLFLGPTDWTSIYHGHVLECVVPEASNKQMQVTPQFVRERIPEQPAFASKEYLQQLFGKPIEQDQPLFWNPSLVLDNPSIQQYYK